MDGKHGALLEGFLRGDDEALRALMAQHGTALMSFIDRYVGDPAGADDLYQEAWIRAFNSRRRYDPSRPFRNWLFAIALNLVRTYCQNRKRRQAAEESKSPAPISSDLSDLREFIDKLPEEERQVFLLREMHGFSYEEIADLTQRPVGTLKSQMHYAVQRLKRILEPIWTAMK